MLEVGQALWYVPADSRYIDQSRSVTVTKLGRKWATLSHESYKIDLETLWVDGGRYSSPGRCWLSKDAWESEMRRIKVWQEFQRRLSHHPPDNVSTETILNVSNLLGIPVA